MDDSKPKIKNSHFIGRSVFIRFLGVIYLIAFGSLWTQLIGLIGEDGILPISNYLIAAEQHFGGRDFFSFPTLFWINSSDAAIHFVCALGVILSIVVILGFLPAVNLFILWLLYLSVYYAGQDFLGFQWDILLLEVGFLSIFLSPWRLKLNSSKEAPVRIIVLLLWLVLFKMMVQSGLVKILSNDATWADLTALNYHYFTQPIPNPVSWYVHHLPEWFQKMSCLGMFFVELIVPFGIFIHRRTRLVAGWLLIGLQGLIIFTGNYCFFNLLTINLCLLLFDDRHFKSLIVLMRLKIPSLSENIPNKNAIYWTKTSVSWVIVVMIVVMTTYHFMLMSGKATLMPKPIVGVISKLRTFAINNSYGLFAIMTTKRYEIIIEGSMDQEEWKAYEFPYKPGDLTRIPPQVAPHQPRLDWHMWFAALNSDIRYAPWMVSFMKRILEGSKEVQNLLSYDPFEGIPPKYIRAKLYAYEFTAPQERRRTKEWWKRTFKKMYSPVISLDMFEN